MKKISIGLRMNSNGELSYFGLDDVNSCIEKGQRVRAIKEGNALMQKISDQDGNVKLKLSGCSLTVLLDE